jgi:dihydrofolate reductase
MEFDIVVAVDQEYGIGRNNSVPWKLSDDMRFFKSLTSTASPGKRNAVIMGRKTWDSLPPKSRPLKDRLNIVLSRTPLQMPEGVENATSLDRALEIAEKHSVDHCFVIGGAQIYKDALEHPSLHIVYLTRIDASFDCDVFFPKEPPLDLVEKCEPKVENGIRFSYEQLRPARKSVAL